MAVPSNQIADLRRACALTEADTTYTAEVLERTLERYPLVDKFGNSPTINGSGTNPMTEEPNPKWMATYDVNAAAAQIWGEKAALYASEYDFKDNDQQFNRSQKHEHALKMQRYYRSRSAPRSITVYGQAYNPNVEPVWIGNLPEPD